MTDRENLFYVSRGNSIGEYSDWFPPVQNIDAARKLVQDLDGDATIWRYQWFDDSETYEPIIIE